MALSKKTKTASSICARSCCARHAFTTRYGGVSTGDMGHAEPRLQPGRRPGGRARKLPPRLRGLFGVGIDDAAVTNQVHGNAVRIVTAADRHVCMSQVPYEADGIVTAERACRSSASRPTACPCCSMTGSTPPPGRSTAAGAAPSGTSSRTRLTLWRLSARKRRASTPAIGPAIGRCCFETDDDVPEAVTAWLGGDDEGLFDRRPDGKTMVDLRAANARRLIQLGVLPENIDVSDECTYCRHDKYWSHRYTHGRRGSQAALIVLD